ncbi:MAG: tripartite tricarboxylate transporter TctB family protein [Mesorhizobium sp.]|uniref:tripartite tricarboxylate transporter TctB family protein n=1 Tax=Mesorhizobium sp. TaxID=1871066 RepID=UPI000FE8EDA2|nr:tripartite tricarboxylate transporter TctB family protein [Mesorhizobium sp.]RWH72416.1 MAG: tripartite tricarboxylate transporter TctB family protein [Mesorhizobium sp.]RWH77831.1 MAG: tripartite tricarboxylate transporter TctB family protein [Mesorhizobium sp.]RWH85555.1 MAG: tripartite tricarboxylate transporter TctB family protein [Mesorhizobium sp.]RWH92798.1 MAG: tripartite tricarboxylate transporter TctB family protein [Mesorhizobium sp.]RWH97575.1 MAG: tripartite tricarboxylate tran
MSNHHQPSARATQLIGRGAALCLALLAIAYGIGGSIIGYAFSSDPLGPRVFPVALSIVLGVLAAWYFFTPGDSEGFPSGRLLWRVIGIPVTLIVSVLMFEPIGFAASTFVLSFAVALIFEAPLKKALIGAVGHAALWWFVFSFLLEVYLPVGAMFAG